MEKMLTSNIIKNLKHSLSNIGNHLHIFKAQGRWNWHGTTIRRNSCGAVSSDWIKKKLFQMKRIDYREQTFLFFWEGVGGGEQLTI